MSPWTAEGIAPDEAIALSRPQDTWIAGYVLRYERGKFRASFLYDDTELEADTLGGLDSSIRGHWARSWHDGSNAGPAIAPWSAG